MNHKEKLLELYNKACSLKSDSFELEEKLQNYIKTIALNSITQKGVYTVLITLAIHKLLFPKQDIRLHQEKMKNAGRKGLKIAKGLGIGYLIFVGIIFIMVLVGVIFVFSNRVSSSLIWDFLTRKF